MDTVCEESRCIALGVLLIILTIVVNYCLSVWKPANPDSNDNGDIRKNPLFCPGFGVVSSINNQMQPNLKAKPKKKEKTHQSGRRQIRKQDDALLRDLDVHVPKETSYKQTEPIFFQDQEREADANFLFKQFTTTTGGDVSNSRGNGAGAPPSRSSMFEQQVHYPKLEINDATTRQMGPSFNTMEVSGHWGSSPYQQPHHQPHQQTPYQAAPASSFQYTNPRSNSQVLPQYHQPGGEYRQTYDALRNAQNDDQFLQTLQSLKSTSSGL